MNNHITIQFLKLALSPQCQQEAEYINPGPIRKHLPKELAVERMMPLFNGFGPYPVQYAQALFFVGVAGPASPVVLGLKSTRDRINVAVFGH